MTDRVAPTTETSVEELPPGREIGRQAIWNYLVFAVCKAMTLVMTILLARLLRPAEFGLFALALLVMTMFDYVRDLGVAVALVQSPQPWGRLAPTGLTLSTIFGLLMAALVAATAPWTTAVMGAVTVTSLVQVLAIGLAISALGVLPLAELRRRLDFRHRLIPEMLGAIVKVAVAIGLAVIGSGVWSLVWAQVSASAVTTVGYWAVVRPSLSFRFDRAAARDLIRFGLPVTAVGFLSFAISNVDYAAIGRRLGPEALGFYTLAYRLPELLVLNLCVVVGDVLFSVLSRVQHNRPELAEKYLSTLRMVVAATAAMGFGLAAISSDLVGVLYGAGYAPVGGILAVLAVLAVLFSINFHAGDVYKAIGRPGLLTWLGVLKLAMLVPAVWWAAGRSTLTVAFALFGVEVVITVVSLVLVYRVLNISIGRQLLALWEPVTAAVVMAILLWSTVYALPDWAHAARLVVLVPMGMVLYLGLLRLLAPSLWAAAISTWRQRAGRTAIP